MNPNRFFSVPYDARNNTKVLRLGVLQRNKMQAFGRWMALLGMLYDENGLIDMSDKATGQIVVSELCFSNADQAIRFLDDCAEAGLIDRFVWDEMRHVVSLGVADELAYRRGKAAAGKEGGKASRRKQTDKQDDKQNAKQEIEQEGKQTDKPLSLSLS